MLQLSAFNTGGNTQDPAINNHFDAPYDSYFLDEGMGKEP